MIKMVITLGKEAEVQATRWRRKWTEKNRTDLSENGLHFQVPLSASGGMELKMNVEQAYVKTNEQTKIAQIVEKRINACSENLESNLKLEVPNSYKVMLATDKKRKVAISGLSNGWISILESKEVNDYYRFGGDYRGISTSVCNYSKR